MDSIIQILFLITLLGSLLYSIRNPHLAVALGVAVFGLEQIFIIIFPVLRVHQSWFNIVFGCVFVIIFFLGLLQKKVESFHTARAKKIYFILLVFVVFYWVSLAWSPFTDVQSNLLLIPYFILYLLLMPFLISDSQKMIKALAILWAVLFLGFLWLFVSGELSVLVSSQIGRARVSLGQTDVGFFTNPLTIADTGVFLAMASFLVLISVKKRILACSIAAPKPLVTILCFIGAALGMWVAFLSSRAETLIGFIFLGIFAVLASARNVRRAISISLGTIMITGSLLLLIYVSFYETIIQYVPMFNREAIAVGWNIRIGLIHDSLAQFVSNFHSIIFGIGARGCEYLIGFWPHNAFVQSLAETGILGFLLFLACILMTIAFGFKTYKGAKEGGSDDDKLWTAFVICLFLYNLTIFQKKGSLSEHHVYMWIVFSAAAFDRVRQSIKKRANIRSRRTEK